MLARRLGKLSLDNAFALIEGHPKGYTPAKELNCTTRPSPESQLSK
jgi:hypothetical protein